MKLRLTALTLVVSLGAAHAASADPIAADSRITHVTVYSDSALVTREATVEVPEGTQVVLFENLPESIDPNLIQVSGTGTADAAILDVTATRAQLESPANARLAELQEQARSIRNELRTLDDRANVLAQQRDYYEKIKVASVRPQGGGKDEPMAFPSVSAWEQFITFYTDGLAKSFVASQTLERERESVQNRLDAVQRQIESLQAPGEKTVYNVGVRLGVAASGNLTVKLNYTVQGAFWRPAYDVRVSSTDRSIALGYAAMVTQRTGEDWDDVNLILSTARPAVGGTPPTLSPWFVAESRPVPMPAAAARDKLLTYTTDREIGTIAGNFAAAPELGDSVEETRALRQMQAAVAADLTSATFAIAAASDIPADNAPHKVSITSIPLDGKMNHLAIPKLAEAVYLRAEVTNGSEFPLMPGPANMYLDGTLVAHSQIRTVMAGEKFVLNLGVDDGISIKRKLVNRLTEDTGLMSKRKKVTYDVLITVQNNRKSDEQVVVKDQLPISKHEKIVVTMVEPPERDIRKDEDGTISWTVDLKPGEKRELKLKISVEHPVDLPVTGLE